LNKTIFASLILETVNSEIQIQKIWNVARLVKSSIEKFENLLY